MYRLPITANFYPYIHDYIYIWIQWWVLYKFYQLKFLIFYAVLVLDIQ